MLYEVITDSIYQAVGLKEPKGIAAFVDPSKDPQYYVDRYNIV